MQTIGRSLQDLSPAHMAHDRNIFPPLIWSALGLLVVMAFIGWLLVGSPPSQMASQRTSAVYAAQPVGK